MAEPDSFIQFHTKDIQGEQGATPCEYVMVFPILQLSLLIRSPHKLFPETIPEIERKNLIFERTLLTKDERLL
jgi:hypothetical protein